LSSGKKRRVGRTPLIGPKIKVSNLVYESAKRNDGFLIMPNEIEAYRIGAKKFEFKGTNGFVVTYDIASKDFDAVK
jgi:hypothetical protein